MRLDGPVHRGDAVGGGAPGAHGDLGVGGVGGGGGAEAEVVDGGGDLGERLVGAGPAGVDRGLVDEAGGVAVGDLLLDRAEGVAERGPHAAEVGAALGAADSWRSARTVRASSAATATNRGIAAANSFVDNVKRRIGGGPWVELLGYGSIGPPPRGDGDRSSPRRMAA